MITSISQETEIDNKQLDIVIKQNSNYVKINSNVSAVVELITPKVAEEYLKLNVYNRKLDTHIVDFYCSLIKNGQWKLNGEAIKFLKDGTLSDGQHRLSAIIKSNTPIESLVIRGIDNDCMSTFDSGKNRTISDVFNLSKIPNYASVSSIVNKYLQISRIGGFGSNGGFDRKRCRVSKQDILDEYRNNEEIFKKAHDISSKKKLNILEGSLIGGIIVFLVKNKNHDIELVTNFFDQLLDENTNSTNSTIILLRAKLINDNSKVKRMTYNHRYNLIVKTWNSFIRQKNLKTLNCNDVEEFL